MSDTKQGADKKPQNQTSEDKGTIKSVQRDGNSKRGQETQRGSEPETRAASSNRN